MEIEEPHKLNSGDVLHILEVLVIIASFIGAVARFDSKFDENAKQVEIHTKQLDLQTQQLTRMEHYLASKDPEYYRRSKDDE